MESGGRSDSMQTNEKVDFFVEDLIMKYEQGVTFIYLCIKVYYLFIYL